MAGRLRDRRVRLFRIRDSNDKSLYAAYNDSGRREYSSFRFDIVGNIGYVDDFTGVWKTSGGKSENV